MSAHRLIIFGIALAIGNLSTALAQQAPTAIGQPDELPDAPSATLAEMQDPSHPSETPQQPAQDAAQAPSDGSNTADQKKQPTRILWVIPNYRAVSSDLKLPPLTPRQKLKLMVDDTFDYSAFLYVGFVAGLRMAAASYPEFGEGPADTVGTTGAFLSITLRETPSPSGYCRWLSNKTLVNSPRGMAVFGAARAMRRAGSW